MREIFKYEKLIKEFKRIRKATFIMSVITLILGGATNFFNLPFIIFYVVMFATILMSLYALVVYTDIEKISNKRLREELN